MKKFPQLVKKFKEDKSGAFAPMFAVCSLALFVTAGAAIDMARISHTNTIVRDALDAAILAAARDLSDGKATDGELRGQFEAFFFANVEHRGTMADNVEISSFNADSETGIITASASAELDMAIMGIAGIPKWETETSSEARFSNDKIEVAMMLDVTGSMRRQGKLDSLKRAAADAVDILLPNGTANNGKVRIGLVPYANSVNVESISSVVTNGGSTNGCVTERAGPQAFSDAAHGRNAWIGAATASCPYASVKPLTNDDNILKTEIARYTPSGTTAGHLGVAWSYYMLSENWKSVWGASAPAEYSDKVQKIAILMTDGEFNKKYEPSLGDSDDIAIATCDDMKANKGAYQGIRIYSVAFKAPSDAEATLRACASPDTSDQTHYFSADSEAELRSAFQQIALNIQKLRLSK